MFLLSCTLTDGGIAQVGNIENWKVIGPELAAPVNSAGELFKFNTKLLFTIE